MIYKSSSNKQCEGTILVGYLASIYSSFLLAFNEHMYLGPNQLLRGLLDVLNHGWTFRVSEQWFQR